MNWHVGIARRIITPQTDVWQAGYGVKRVPGGKIHDLWAKVLCLEDSSRHCAVMVTTDCMGISKSIYENLCGKMHRRFGINRADFMLTFSHNHCGPVLKDDVEDYYPLDEQQRHLINAYSEWMEEQIVDAVGEALADLRPAHLAKGEGRCTFAVNRRENTEEDVLRFQAEGKPLKGATDHYVPVLAVKDEAGALRCVLFGYACHPTMAPTSVSWCGDYPGFAQVYVEDKYPGASAMFFNTCGADQGRAPQAKLTLAEQCGRMLAEAVDEVLRGPMQSVSSGLKTAFEFIDLAYDEIVTRKTLLPAADGDSKLHDEEDEIVRAVHVRWAKRMLKMMDAGVIFPTSYPYPVQAWRMGRDLLLISLGGEAVVDYSLRFKHEFEPTTWVCGYANDMVAYIPSRRVWEEGGYEGGRHLYEYGRPAWRWSGDVEDRIADAVRNVVAAVAVKN